MIYIIIPVFNRLEYTRDCIQSLVKQTFSNFKIIIVDDGSTDGTSEYIQQFFPDVQIVQGDGNWWWAKSTNMGIRSILDSAKDDDFILTLNNDLVVLADYLESLIAIYDKCKPCVVGSISIWNDGSEKIEFAGVEWNPFTAKYGYTKIKKITYSELKNEKQFLPTDLLPGRGTLYPISLIRQIGLYDDVHFPQYAADEDFSLRAKQAGHLLLVSTVSAVVSNVSETGINFRYDKPSIRKFIYSLISIRSANNLKIRFFFATKHAKVPWIYFTFDFFRICGSFVKHYLAAFSNKR